MHDTLGWILGTGLQGDLRAVSLLGLPPGSAFVREVRLDQGGGVERQCITAWTSTDPKGALELGWPFRYTLH